MRFEKLVWFVLAMFLSAGATFEETSIVGAVGEEREYQAADGTSQIPPP